MSVQDSLDTASVGSLGLIQLLMALSFEGLGLVLRQAKHRGACRRFFSAMVDIILGDAWQLHLFMTAGQVWNHRHKPHSDKYLALSVDGAGMVRLAPWHATANPEHRGEFPLPFAENSQIDRSLEHMHLTDFLEHLCAQPFCHPIARQVGWRRGDRFESACMFALFQGRPLRAPAAVVMSNAQADHGQPSVDRFLVAYWHAGRDAAAQHGAAQMCSVAVDKSSVGGKRVSNGMVCLANNIAWWMVPQVPAGFWGRVQACKLPKSGCSSSGWLNDT